jgi:hypothetical protein
MNINYYKEIMTRNTINNEDLKVYYNFSNISGDLIVFNELYPTSSQYNEGCIVFDNNPGFIVGYNPSGFNDFSGSGFFNGNAIFRISKNIEYDNWTVFLGYQNSGCDIEREIGTVLIANKENIYDESGFCLGFNGAGKYFIEQRENDLNKTFTTNFAGQKNALLSLSKNNNDFEISIHDVANNSHKTESFLLENYNPSNLWFLGNAYNTNQYYTGLKGYIDDFVMISGFISSNKRIELAKALFLTGYIPPTSILKQEYFLKNDNISYTQNEIIGTGITGYQNITIGTIPRKEGDPISICLKSGLTGLLYGDVIKFVKTNNSGIRNYYERQPEEFLYDKNLMLKYADSSLRFLNVLDEKDICEIYSFLTNSTEIKNLNLFDAFTDSVYLDIPYSNQNINLYLNGVKQQAVSNQENLNISGDYYLKDPQNIYSSGIYEALIDDINYYSITNSGIYINYTGIQQDQPLCPNNFNNILYLNGQKLISGINYYISGNNFYLKNNQILSTGVIHITNDINDYLAYTSGNGYEIQSIAKQLSNEKIWINGILQIQNKDYLKAGCVTLLPSDYISKSKNYLIYDNESNFFNLL